MICYIASKLWGEVECRLFVLLEGVVKVIAPFEAWRKGQTPIT